MKPLPDRVSLDHLKKQAKDLIRLYRSGDPEAITRFLRTLPVAANRKREEIAALALRLHDAQSCVAREYGFASWADLKSYAEVQSVDRGDLATAVRTWLEFVYPGDVTGQSSRARPGVAARMLAETPDLATGNPYLACAAGDEARLRRATELDPAWINRMDGPLNLPPLLAVTHSSLVRIPELQERFHACVRFLLTAGADPNQRIGNRWPPASLSKPDNDHPLSALYAAAGSIRDAVLTKLLLDAGADPNDGESLYHSLENLDCMRLLLEHGARIEGTNALYRALDLEDPAPLELLLSYGGDANEPARNAPLTDWGSPLLWAIRRRRSRRHVEALLAAGADLSVTTPTGTTSYKLALQFGLTDVAELLNQKGAGETLSEEELFIAACARADEAEAQRISARRPDLPSALSAAQLRLLPDITAEGGREAAMIMVTLGWPVAVRGGDWDASALNNAVFRGDEKLTRFLLEHGARWTEEHGHGDNVCGTLSWASTNEPVEGGDWAGCARALLDHGMPSGEPDRENPEIVLIGGRRKRFSDEVTEVLLGGSAAF
jgi:ankyrin repeat protein